MRQLTATDALFLQLERPDRAFHIGMLQIYQPLAGRSVPTLDEVLSDLQSRLHLSASFRQKIVTARFGLDFPYWIDDPDFDLEYHVRHVALPRPGDFQQLSAVVSRLHARILDRTRPLWEITLIEGLDGIADIPAGSFAVFFKIHHAAIDGVAGAELLSVIHSTDPDAASPVAPAGAWNPEDLPSGRRLLIQAAGNNVRRPVKALRSALPALPSPLSVAKSAVRMPKRSSTDQLEPKSGDAPKAAIPLTRFNGSITGHRTFDSRACALEDLKRIKNAEPGATVNDVAMAVIGGALRSYLDAHGELPEADTVALAPVSTRPPTDAAGGNRISAMLIPLGSDIADPRERLAHIAKATQAKKGRANAVRARALAEAAEVVPGAVVGVAMRRLGPALATRRAVANVVATNVPGPPDALYGFGARMLRLYGLGPGLRRVRPHSPGRQLCRRLLLLRDGVPRDAPGRREYGDHLDRTLDDLRRAFEIEAARLPSLAEPEPDGVLPTMTTG